MDIRKTVETGIYLRDNLSEEQIESLKAKGFVYEYLHTILGLDEPILSRQLESCISDTIKSYLRERIKHNSEMQTNFFLIPFKNKLQITAYDDTSRMEYILNARQPLLAKLDKLCFASSNKDEMLLFYLSDYIIYEDILPFITDDAKGKQAFWMRYSKLDWVVEELGIIATKSRIEALNILLKQNTATPEKETPNIKMSTIAFDQLFPNDSAKQKALDCFRDLTYTKNGKWCSGTPSILRAVVEELKEKYYINEYSIGVICQLFGNEFGLKIPRAPRSEGTSYYEAKKNVKHYLK